ncbi:hypothetical protein [Falsibacillus albus]|uniref:Lipoprotein n=1 Tax=Falsibacillus albus TaxID=2478915 RepID=A0A3L7K194_9BACI|nr:hypothetical protein [Falsibacillus albus]RLQ96838.1 hypothetical protein D9X91_06990 [Falsibacillus albus]
MLKYMLMIVFSTFLLCGCSYSEEKISTFEGQIDYVSGKQIKVDCSNTVAANSEESGDQVGVGYICFAAINGQTKLEDNNGNSLSINDFTIEDKIKIFLESPKNIGKSLESRKFTASKVILIKASPAPK